MTIGEAQNTTDQGPSRADRLYGIAAAATLVGLAGLGLWLRLIGLRYGLPAVYNPDEVAIMNRAMAFGTGQFNPHNFVYPTFYFYALFIWEGLTFGFAWLATWVNSPSEFERSFWVDPTLIYTSGRLLSVICGVLTLFVVARLGTRLFGRRTGLIAAGLLAVAPIAVRDAHYVKHDVPVTFLIVLTVAAAASLLIDDYRHATRGAWMRAGVLAGLAMSTHYYAIFVALPIVVAAIFGSRRGTRLRTLGYLALAGAVAALTFFAGSPFLLVEPMTAWRDIVANREIVMDGAVAPGGPFASSSRYLYLLLLDGLGWPAGIAAVAGVGVALWRHWRRGLLLLAFPTAFLAFIANTVPASRYLNPLLPFAAITAAIAIVAVAERAKGWGLAACIGVTALAGAPALGASIRAGAFFRQADTRTLAHEMIVREVPAGATVLVQPYSVPLRPTRESLIEGLRANLGSEDKATVKFRRQLELKPYPAPAWRLIWLGTGGLDAEKIYVPLEAVNGPDPLAPLRARKVQYVVLKYNAEESATAALRAALAASGRLLATFAPYREDAGGQPAPAPFLHNTDARIDAALARPGPPIEVWQIR
ncbi:MAG TPA: glycosyltransferase family 39 protein [Vicinamibacterales bacterium]|nr:glycosyltransferase family 39 protein [Vicinamibacterales bacterium]